MWGFYRKFSGQVSRLHVLPNGAGGGRDVDGTDQNILLVGNDSRRGLTAAQLRAVGTTADPGLDTDTILLIHIPADGRQATAVSFPRDSYVDIPGYKKNKINAAYADGACIPHVCGNTLSKQQEAAGARLLIQTVTQLSGLHIDHYVEVSLLGFYTISNAVGGVDVCLARRWYDPEHEAGIDVPPGQVTLKGKLALAFVRERYTLPNGDLDRIRRQQAFASALIRKLLGANVLLNPIKLNRLIGAVATSFTFDQTLDPIKLAEQLRDIAAGQVRFITMPTKGNEKTSEGKDVLAVDPNAVRQFFGRVIGKNDPSAPSTASAVPRGKVSVTVQNGTSREGLATTTRTRLASLGFQVTGAGNADSSGYPTTQIRYPPGQQGAARTLAGVVPGAAMVAVRGGSSVRLILGANFAGVRAPAPHPPASTTGGAPTSTRPPGAPEQRTASDTSCVN